MADDAQQVTLAGADPAVGAHTVVAGVGRIDRDVLDPVVDHVLLHPADEEEGALPPAAVPVAEVDPGLVVDDDDARALRHPLAEPLGLDPFEGAHVVLVEPFGRRQVAEGVRAQVGAVEVAHGHLHPVMPGIVGGGLVPVAVGREACIALQLGDPGQAVRQHGIGRPDQGPAHIPEHLQPARAAEAGEGVGVARHVRETRAVLL